MYGLPRFCKQLLSMTEERFASMYSAYDWKQCFRPWWNPRAPCLIKRSVITDCFFSQAYGAPVNGSVINNYGSQNTVVLNPTKCHDSSSFDGQSRKRTIDVAAGQNLPTDASDLVGQGNQCDVWVSTLFKLVQPLPHACLLSFHVDHECACALDQ